MKRLTVLLLCCALFSVAPAMAHDGAERPSATFAGVTIYALTTANRLVSFNSTAPQTPLSNVQITGFQAGEDLVEIDFRPLTEDLYLLTTQRLYLLNPDTGVATPVGAPFTTALIGTEYGFDFNPTVDRARIVDDNLQNIRVNPDTGAIVSVDTALHYATGDPHAGTSPVIVGAAYTNNFPGATSTTLYDIDSNLDILTIQNPPNDGTLTTVGGLGVDTSELVGFDIQTGIGTAYAALTPESDGFSRLYTIDLSTGLATLIGPIGGTGQVRGIAIPIGIKQGADTVGVYDPNTANWFLRNSNTPGPADISFVFGGGGTAVPVRGDFDGDGVDTIGIYVPATGVFFLRNSNSTGTADLTFGFGAGGAGYVPIVGDWNGDGVDTVGLYNPATGAFFLRNANSSGPANIVFTFGAGGGGFVPIAGDWNGDGLDTVGLYNPTSAAFFLRNSNSSGPADITFTYGPAGAVPVAGDYDNNGTDTVGVYVAASATFFLKNSNSGGPADLAFTYGLPNEKPLVGDWDGQ